MRRALRGGGVKQLISGRWYAWRKKDRHVCCNCGFEHDVELKVDKRGRVWMRWTVLD